MIQNLFWILTFILKKEIKNNSSVENVDIDLVPFSIVISARNEAENLSKNLSHILNQNYPSFEVIVIDDDSRDETQQILVDYQKLYPNLSIVKMEHKQKEGKKDGLKMGIEKAKFEWIVLTDADCFPKTDQWLYHISIQCTNGKEIVLGYSPYLKGKGILNDFIRYETFITAILYGTFTKIGMPYMGVGRNMAYKKSSFQKIKKDKNRDLIPYGDDDLTINAMAGRKNTALQFVEDSWVMTFPKTTFTAFLKQKTRHIAASAYYRNSHQWILGILASSQALLYPSIILLLMTANPLFISLIMSRMTIYFLRMNFFMKRMDLQDILKKAFLLDFLFFLYYWIISIRWFFNRKVSW